MQWTVEYYASSIYEDDIWSNSNPNPTCGSVYKVWCKNRGEATRPTSIMSRGLMSLTHRYWRM